MARIPALPEGDIVDLGCGNGAVAQPLVQRFPGRRLIGVDTSRAMLVEAESTGAYYRCLCQDASKWAPETPPALIFANASLQWLGDHENLLPQLALQLAPGGTLAIQMPRQNSAPSHRLLWDFATDMFPDRFDPAEAALRVAAPVDYWRLLCPLGQVDIWETEYLQRLDPVAGAHPVRRFTEATAMRPVLSRMSAQEISKFLTRYEAALSSVYPVEADGSVLFPFRRLFIVLSVPAI